MNIKNSLVIILLCLGLQTAIAQETYNSSGRPVTSEKRQSRSTGFDASRIIWGGGFGFGFGTVTNVNVSPIIGYRFTDQFSAGVGFRYQYFRIKDAYELTDPANPNEYIYKPYTANVYSPSVWTRYVFYRNLFAHLEYEHNFINGKGYDYGADNAPGSPGFKIVPYDEKVNAPSLLLGLGLRAPISDRVSLQLLGLYDVIQDKNSPYRGTLVLRFGIVAGF